MIQITTTWDVVYRPFPDSLDESSHVGPYHGLLERIAVMLDDDLERWGDIDLAASEAEGWIILSVNPLKLKDWRRAHSVDPSLDALHHDVAQFLAAHDLEGTFDIRVTTTVMQEKIKVPYGD